MREIPLANVTELVEKLCVEANRKLPADIIKALDEAKKAEPWELAKGTLDVLVRNLAAAEATGLPICQDTGMACVFLEVGQEIHFTGGSLEEAVNQGVCRGYVGGYLRKSIVSDPLRRTNTGDNTPALLSVKLVPGDGLKVTVAPKGIGSENMSRIAMLKPADGRQGVIDFVLETVRLAGANPCPPIVVGVGIGGSFDKSALLAKEALLQPLDLGNPDPYYRELEKELLKRINFLGIGPAGYGGRTTALGVSVKTGPAHIGGLPVAVNISCHATRRATAQL